MPIPAVPPTTNLRLRLHKPDGTPLASTWYRITWGLGAPLPLEKTGTDGSIDVDLDGNYVWGTLELGEVPEGTTWGADPKLLVPRIVMDLRLVKPPSPPKKHKRPLLNEDPPPAPPPPASKPSPSNPAPGKPAPGEGGEADDPEEGGPARPNPALIAMPPDKKPTHDFDPEGRYRRTDKKPDKPKESSAEVERRLEKLDRISADYHDKSVKVREITWRLHNLGYLGFWSGHLTFPIDGGKYAEILDAMNRYAFKHGLSLLTEADLTGPDPTLDGIMRHLKKTHDDDPVGHP